MKRAKVSTPKPASVDHDHSYFNVSTSSFTDLSSIDEEAFQSTATVETDVGGIFAKFLGVIVYLYGFMLISNVLNFMCVFALRCHQQLNLIKILNAQVLSLRDENDCLRRQIHRLQKREVSCKCKLPLFDQLIQNDDDVYMFIFIQEFLMLTHLKSWRSLLPHMSGICGGEPNTHRQRLKGNSDQLLAFLDHNVR